MARPPRSGQQGDAAMTRPFARRFPLALGATLATVMLAGCLSTRGFLAFGRERMVLRESESEEPCGESRQTNTESYRKVDENPFLAARDNPLSTFSIDV